MIVRSVWRHVAISFEKQNTNFMNHNEVRCKMVVNRKRRNGGFQFINTSVKRNESGSDNFGMFNSRNFDCVNKTTVPSKFSNITLFQTRRVHENLGMVARYSAMKKVVVLFSASFTTTKPPLRFTRCGNCVKPLATASKASDVRLKDNIVEAG